MTKTSPPMTDNAYFGLSGVTALLLLVVITFALGHPDRFRNSPIISLSGLVLVVHLIFLVAYRLRRTPSLGRVLRAMGMVSLSLTLLLAKSGLSDDFQVPTVFTTIASQLNYAPTGR